jgi:hypothetical protein
MPARAGLAAGVIRIVSWTDSDSDSRSAIGNHGRG